MSFWVIKFLPNTSGFSGAFHENTTNLVSANKNGLKKNCSIMFMVFTFQADNIPRKNSEEDHSSWKYGRKYRTC